MIAFVRCGRIHGSFYRNICPSGNFARYPASTDRLGTFDGDMGVFAPCFLRGYGRTVYYPCRNGWPNPHPPVAK